MLLSLFGPRADDVSDRSPWGDFFFKPVPWKGGAAEVTPDIAMQLTAVFACVRIIAEGVSMLPFTLRRPKDGGGWQYDTKHWLYHLFARRPNAFQNPFEFREMLQGHLCLRGNAFARIIPGPGGSVTDLLPMHPDAVRVEYLDNGSWRYRLRQQNGEDKVLARDEVFHIRGLSSDGVMGISPIAAARESIAVGLAAQSYGARYFQNDGKPGGGWIEYPGTFKDAEARKVFRDAWQTAQAGKNRGKTAVLEFGMKYHDVDVANDEAQFLETRQFQVTDIARLFRVPPHLIGDLTRATFSNIEQQSIDYVMHTLTPWNVRWEHAIKSSFLDEDDDANVNFPTRELLRGDLKARGDFYSSGILDGWLTRNEARLDDGREPINGLDEPLVPLNMIPADQLGKEPPAGDEAAPPPKPGQSPQPPKENSRAQALAAAGAERVARKEMRLIADVPTPYTVEALEAAFSGQVNFVAAVLGVNRSEARAYCDGQIETLLLHGEVHADYEDLARSRLERLALGLDT